MQGMNEDVFRFLDQEPVWTFGNGMIMSGLIAVSRVTGDEEYKRAVLDFMRNSVSAEGTILPAPASTTDLVSCGKALFFALDETGEERFRKALDAVASEVNMAPLPDTPKGLYAIAPFLAEYDTRFGGKQAYKAIANHFKAVHQTLFDRKTGLYCTDVSRFSILNEGFMLMALADTAQKMDIQIYEHYPTLAVPARNEPAVYQPPRRFGAKARLYRPGHDPLRHVQRRQASNPGRGKIPAACPCGPETARLAGSV